MTPPKSGEAFVIIGNPFQRRSKQVMMTTEVEAEGLAIREADHGKKTVGIVLRF
jgi:hypothetical protein